MERWKECMLDTSRHQCFEEIMHLPPRGMIYAIYYTALAGIAVPVNLLAIAILSRGKCGLSRCITRYLVSMAVTDLLVIITAVLLNRIPGIYFPGSVLSITPICSLTIALIYAARDTSVWLTVAFTVDRFVAICCQKFKVKYCTDRMSAVVIGTVCSLGCLKNIPWYFLHEPMYISNNIPWYCRLKKIRHTSLLWTTFEWFEYILTPCFPFFLILLLNALTVRNILVVNKARRRLRSQLNEENKADPEMESRKKSIILLFAVSGSFILLWLLFLIYFLYERFTNDYQITGFSDPQFIFREIGNMLQLFSACTNTFIYAITQSKFREELQNIVRNPLIACAIVKKKK